MKLKKRWKRILLALIFVPIVLLGALLLYIQSNQAEIIKGEIAKLNQEHKGRITVGDSELALWGNFPDISIKIYDVRILETKADNAPLIADVKDIYVGFNLWDMLEGNYDIRSLLVEEGVFHLVIHEDNTTNIQNALESTTAVDGPTTNIHLKKIKLKYLKLMNRYHSYR